jgi:hypothetical protein
MISLRPLLAAGAWAFMPARRCSTSMTIRITESNIIHTCAYIIVYGRKACGSSENASLLQRGRS